MPTAVIRGRNLRSHNGGIITIFRIRLIVIIGNVSNLSNTSIFYIKRVVSSLKRLEMLSKIITKQTLNFAYSLDYFYGKTLLFIVT